MAKKMLIALLLSALCWCSLGAQQLDGAYDMPSEKERVQRTGNDVGTVEFGLGMGYAMSFRPEFGLRGEAVLR